MNRWLSLFALLLVTGCVSSPQPFTSTSSQQALVLWKRSDRTLVSEAIFSRAADSSVRAQLYKGTPKVLLTPSLDATQNIRVSGPMAGLGWHGAANDAPLPLLVWSHLMMDYQRAPSWPDGDNEIHSGDVRTAISIARHQLRSLSISNNLNGDTLTAKFHAP
jgi:hypothetical protein